jgi:protein TonB
MSSTTTYKLIRMGVLAALITGGAVACKYKAGSDYKDNSDTTSANMPAAAPANVPPAATSAAPATTDPGAATPAKSTASGTTAAPATPTNKAKFARGRASVTAPKIYTTAEVAPQFPGGQRALDNYINKSVNYPQQAIDDDVSGTVHVSFVVDEKGRVTKAKVVNAANVGDGLDLEALRVVKNMPQWMPGKVNGKRVKTRMELPISFQVES